MVVYTATIHTFYALLEMAKREGLKKVYVHCFLDGRDTPPASGKEFIEQLEAKMKEIGVGQIGVVSGRYYAMDRDNRWDRVELAYKALTEGEGVKGNKRTSRQFRLPMIMIRQMNSSFRQLLKKTDSRLQRSRTKDSIVFFNFRPDRA